MRRRKVQPAPAAILVAAVMLTSAGLTAGVAPTAAADPAAAAVRAARCSESEALARWVESLAEAAARYRPDADHASTAAAPAPTIAGGSSLIRSIAPTGHASSAGRPRPGPTHAFLRARPELAATPPPAA